MTVFATFNNGKVVLPPDAELPEGAKLRIDVEVAKEGSLPTLNDELGEFIGIFDGPADLAANHDHYAHGAPKRTGQ